MAFDDQVEALTGLTISSSGTNPKESELNQFLVDGVKDVACKVLQYRPQEQDLFSTTSTDSNNSGVEVGSGIVISVARENGSTSDLRPCARIKAEHRHLATNADSIYFRSVYNPGWYWLDKTVFVVPISASSDNDAKVTHVTYDSSVDCTSDTSFTTFPSKYIYLVVLYGAIRSLVNALAGKNISTFSLSAGTPVVTPSAPSISGGSVSDITIASLPTAPAYTAPVVTGDTQEITGTIVAGTPGTAADFINFQHWYDILADLIETEEDTELAQVQISKIQSYIQAYSSAMQNQLNIFNKNNALYQAGVQKNLEQARISMQDAQKTADLTLQASIQDYTLELQRVSTDASKYQALVQAEVQTYRQEIDEVSAEYQWMTARLQDLRQEYAQAFAMMAPAPQVQAGGR